MWTLFEQNECAATAPAVYNYPFLNPPVPGLAQSEGLAGNEREKKGF